MTRLAAINDRRRLARPAGWVVPLLLAALATGGGALCAGEAGDWNPRLHLEYSTILETAVSPDRTLVGFTLRSARVEEGVSEFRSRVWLARADGSGAYPYTDEEYASSSPAFSSDGETLAFLSTRGGGRQIWVRPLGAGAPRQVTQAPNGVTRFNWAPTPSNRLAYLAEDPTSPAGDAWNSHVFILDLDKPDQGVPEAIQVTWGRFHVDDLAWAPSGRRIAVSRRPDPTPGSAITSSDLLVLNLAGRGIRRGLRLTQTEGTENGPRWSTDGRWIAFNGSRDRPQPVGGGDIYVLPESGGEPTRLAATAEQSGNAPLGWNAEGTAVLIAEAAGTGTHLVEVPIDGSAARVVLGGDVYRSAFSQSADGTTVAFVEEGPSTPPEVFVWRKGHGATPTRLTDLHAGVARPPTDPEQFVAFQRAVHAWLAAPSQPAAAKTPPQRPAPQPRRTSFILSEYEPYGDPGNGVIEGQAFLEMPDGCRRYCEFATVFMNPVTTQSTEWYQRNVIHREELEPIPPTGFHWMTRSDKLGRFRFVDLPPGDYYLGCRALPEEGFAHGRASVQDGETVSVELIRRIGGGEPSTFGTLHPEAPPELAHWGQLAGQWECLIPVTAEDGTKTETRSTWTWRYIQGGRAVQDEYVGPRPSGQEPFLGGAIRIFNPDLGVWEVSWVDNRSPGIKRYRATSRPDQIVMTRADEDDPDWRTVFFDITEHEFHWRNEPSGAQMQCERSDSPRSSTANHPR